MFQIREFLREAARQLDEPLLERATSDSWKDALTTVADRWPVGQKLILALDEFQWMANSSPELPSVLQELWDRSWRQRGNVLLILCGSFIGFMEREVLGRGSPLFGRRTAQIHLRPFSYKEAAEFHPAYSLADRARAYFICGGIPLYLQLFKTDRSVEMNIAATLLDEFGPLHQEPDFLLREELREVGNFYAVLLAIAAGALTNSQISAQTGIGDRSLTYYLRQLASLGYISRRHSLTSDRPNAKRVRYALDDPLLRFWFRFVFPDLSFLLQAGPERGLRDRIHPQLDAYFGQCFERLCREALPVLYEREGVLSGYQIGEYWDKTCQIDVVGLRQDGVIDLGECRWGQTRSVSALLTELEAKIARYPNKRNATILPRLFTRQPLPSPADGAVRCHYLEDLYA